MWLKKAVMKMEGGFEKTSFNKTENVSLNVDGQAEPDVRVLAMSYTMHKIGTFFF